MHLKSNAKTRTQRIYSGSSLESGGGAGKSRAGGSGIAWCGRGRSGCFEPDDSRRIIEVVRVRRTFLLNLPHDRLETVALLLIYKTVCSSVSNFIKFFFFWKNCKIIYSPQVSLQQFFYASLFFAQNQCSVGFKPKNLFFKNNNFVIVVPKFLRIRFLNCQYTFFMRYLCATTYLHSQ